MEPQPPIPAELWDQIPPISEESFSAWGSLIDFVVRHCRNLDLPPVGAPAAGEVQGWTEVVRMAPVGVYRSWNRIYAWHNANTPPGTLPSSAGATEQQLADLESLIGTHLPDDFRESYKLCNGTGRGWLLDHGSLLSLAEIATTWQKYRKWQVETGYGEGPDYRPSQLESPEIKPIWWNPLRLPITDNGGGDNDTLDLDPAGAGTRGQIIDVSHEVGPVNLLVRPSRPTGQQYLWDLGEEFDTRATFGTGMAGWLLQIARELESGVHAYSKTSKMVCPVSWGRP